MMGPPPQAKLASRPCPPFLLPIPEVSLPPPWGTPGLSGSVSWIDCKLPQDRITFLFHLSLPPQGEAQQMLLSVSGTQLCPVIPDSQFPPRGLCAYPLPPGVHKISIHPPASPSFLGKLRAPSPWSASGRHRLPLAECRRHCPPP